MTNTPNTFTNSADRTGPSLSERIARARVRVTAAKCDLAALELLAMGVSQTEPAAATDRAGGVDSKCGHTHELVQESESASPSENAGAVDFTSKPVHEQVQRPADDIAPVQAHKLEHDDEIWLAPRALGGGAPTAQTPEPQTVGALAAVNVEKWRLRQLFFACARDAARRGWDGAIGDRMWKGYEAEANELADRYVSAAVHP